MTITPMSPRNENLEASLALGILRYSGGHSTAQAKNELRTRLKLGGVTGITLELRVRTAFATAEKAFKWEQLRRNLETPGYRSPLFNKHISLLAKTADETSHNANKGLLASLNRIEKAAGINQDGSGNNDVVALSQLWTKVKKKVNEDLNEELRGKMLNLVERSSPDVTEEQTQKQRTKELFAIMCLPHDPEAILKEISRANRSIAKRFPDVCKAHVDACVTQLKKNLEAGRTWEFSILVYKESMQELNAKLIILGQAEREIQGTQTKQVSLNKAATDIHTLEGQTKTINQVLNQVVRDIGGWSKFIQLNGKPCTISALIKALGIPLNEPYAQMSESELAAATSTSQKLPLVNEEQWGQMDPQLQTQILQCACCFTATMLDSTPTQKKLEQLRTEEFDVQIVTARPLTKDTETNYPYSGAFWITSNASGLQIEGNIKKAYFIMTTNCATGTKDANGTVQFQTKINSTLPSENQVTFSHGELQPLPRAQDGLGRQGSEQRLERTPSLSRGSDRKNDGYQLNPPSPSHSRASSSYSREEMSGEGFPQEPEAAVEFNTTGRKLDEYSQKHWDAKDNPSSASPVVFHAKQEDPELD